MAPPMATTPFLMALTPRWAVRDSLVSTGSDGSERPMVGVRHRLHWRFGTRMPSSWCPVTLSPSNDAGEGHSRKFEGFHILPSGMSLEMVLGGRGGSPGCVNHRQALASPHSGQVVHDSA